MFFADNKKNRSQKYFFAEGKTNYDLQKIREFSQKKKTKFKIKENQRTAVENNTMGYGSLLFKICLRFTCVITFSAMRFYPHRFKYCLYSRVHIRFIETIAAFRYLVACSCNSATYIFALTCQTNNCESKFTWFAIIICTIWWNFSGKKNKWTIRVEAKNRTLGY